MVRKIRLAYDPFVYRSERLGDGTAFRLLTKASGLEAFRRN